MVSGPIEGTVVGGALARTLVLTSTFSPLPVSWGGQGGGSVTTYRTAYSDDLICSVCLQQAKHRHASFRMARAGHIRGSRLAWGGVPMPCCAAAAFLACGKC